MALEKPEKLGDFFSPILVATLSVLPCRCVSVCVCVCIVVESHPDNVHDDLRLDRPLNSFTEFCDSLDLSSMTRKVNRIAPFV